jgi:nitrogen regulatory protein PII
MKKIEAIIVPAKLNAVRAELERRGINVTLILTEVQQSTEQKASISPRMEVPRSHEDRLKVELVVGDRQVQRAVDAITQYGQVTLLKSQRSSPRRNPLALIGYDKLDDPSAKAEIDRLTVGYDDKPQFFVDKLAQGGWR